MCESVSVFVCVFFLLSMEKDMFRVLPWFDLCRSITVSMHLIEHEQAAQKCF